MDRQASIPLDQPPARASVTPRGELLSIQYLRAAAAIAVLIFHVTDRVGARLGAGAAGVDVFFVISGFIMWVIGARGSPGPAAFLTRRAERIIPLYWAVTMALLGAWMLAPGLFKTLQPTASHVILSLLFVPHADPTGLVAPLVEPGWTLNFEMFFYLVFALTLWVPGQRRLAALTGVLALLVGLGAALKPASAVASTYTSPLLLEFLAGVWLGWAWNKGLRLPILLSVAMLAAGLGAIAYLEWAKIDIAPWRTLAWGGPSVLIVAGGLGLERAGAAPRWPWARFLGDASYSIYLIHGLVVAAVLKIFTRMQGAPLPVMILGAVVASLAAGGLCHVLFERPLTRMLHRRKVKLGDSAAVLVKQAASG